MAVPRPEDEAREIIDAKLAEAGWIVQDRNPSRMRVVPDFSGLLKEHCERGWDGADAPPLGSTAVEQSRLLILTLPSDIPNPQLAVDPDDGAVSLEWYGGPSRVFSISVGGSSHVACAGIDGTDSWHGVVCFDGSKTPDFVLQGIRRILN